MSYRVSLVLDGKRKLGPRANAQLSIDVRQRPLDGLRAEAERRGDLVVGQAVADEIDDAQLGLGEDDRHTPNVPGRFRGFPRD